MAVQISRSPRYPRLSLLDALDYARRFYDGAHKNAVEAEAAYKIMGFAGKNGSSATVVGALRQFGLLTSVRGDIQLTDLALRILQPGSAEERVDAMHHAANLPEAFNAIHAQFAGDLPRSDEPIRSFLIRSLNFSKSGADDCIASLRKTFVELERSGNSSIPISYPDSSVETAKSNNTKHDSIHTSDANVLTSPENQIVKFILGREASAEIRLIGPITPKTLARLVTHIELMADSWGDD